MARDRSAQYDVDQGSAGTPVAVDERVNSFELGVSNRRLRDRR